ncbi:MAG: hypothetical protein ACQEXJ_14525 [Myxococcota bacterium]
MRWFAAALAALLLLAPDTSSAREWEVGVSLFPAYPVGSFIDEPSESDKLVTQNGTTFKVPYPGFGGVGVGLPTLSFSASWRGIIGLETGFGVTLDRGTGEINTIDLTIEQTTAHVPFLLRVGAPLEGVRPYLFGGVDVVLPLDSKLTTDGPGVIAAEADAEADPYWAWAFGLGFEFILPVESVDLRIPLVLGGTLNPNVEDKAVDRFETLECSASGCSTVVIDSAWQYQAYARIGLAWYFL